jgi:hypothetical protein
MATPEMETIRLIGGPADGSRHDTLGKPERFMVYVQAQVDMKATVGLGGPLLPPASILAYLRTPWRRWGDRLYVVEGYCGNLVSDEEIEIGARWLADARVNDEIRHPCTRLTEERTAQNCSLSTARSSGAGC